tara:strand:+ start:3783 stop:4217 length:435 start_codon:yes stop_codon:yes gene_type:complete
MKWAFKKYLVLLYILLWSGFTNLHANYSTDSEYSFSIQKIETNKYSNCDYFEELIAFNIDDDNHPFEAPKECFAEVTDKEEEESDEELSSSITKVKNGGCKTAVFYAFISGHFSGVSEQNLSYFKPNSYTTSFKRHIRFQIFRI